MLLDAPPQPRDAPHRLHFDVLVTTPLRMHLEDCPQGMHQNLMFIHRKGTRRGLASRPAGVVQLTYQPPTAISQQPCQPSGVVSSQDATGGISRGRALPHLFLTGVPSLLTTSKRPHHFAYIPPNYFLHNRAGVTMLALLARAGANLITSIVAAAATIRAVETGRKAVLLRYGQ